MTVPKHNINEVWPRCSICESIAEYAQLVGTNPQDVDTYWYCYSHASDHMSDDEMDEHQLEQFAPLVSVTFEWPSGGKETWIPSGFEEEQEREKKSWENFQRNYGKQDNEDPEQ